MHELSIAISILEVAVEEALRQRVQVRAVHLKLGPLSGVVREAAISAYEMAREDSPFPNSRLVIQDIPVTVFCPKCQAERPAVSPQDICCSICRTPTPQVINGRELEVSALEVIDGPVTS